MVAGEAVEQPQMTGPLNFTAGGADPQQMRPGTDDLLDDDAGTAGRAPRPVTARPPLTRRQRRAARRAKLPWAELEREAARQGCSAADIFFDRAGRPVAGLGSSAPAVAPAPDPTTAPWQTLAPYRRC